METQDIRRSYASPRPAVMAVALAAFLAAIAFLAGCAQMDPYVKAYHDTLHTNSVSLGSTNVGSRVSP